MNSQTCCVAGRLFNRANSRLEPTADAHHYYWAGGGTSAAAQAVTLGLRFDMGESPAPVTLVPNVAAQGRAIV